MRWIRSGKWKEIRVDFRKNDLKGDQMTIQVNIPPLMSFAANKGHQILVA